MQRADDPPAAALAIEIQAFLRQNRALGEPGVATLQAWFRALRNQQWYVPHWPAAYGGLNWTPAQTYVLQRELLLAGRLLPPGATTHLIASWLFSWIPAQIEEHQAQARRWLAGIAGVQGLEAQQWRVGVDLRRPDWPAQALAGDTLGEQAHWVLQPYRTDSGADPEALWAFGVLPGALLRQDAEKLDRNPAQKHRTAVESGVEQRWPPVLSGLTVAEVEALLKPVQLAWQEPAERVGAAGVIAQGLQVPSISLGWRLARVQQVLATDTSLQSEHRSLHESQIALAALQVLEARAAQMDGKLKPELAGADLRQAVGQGAERLSWRVAQLESDTLGYFALPAFDVRLQHNEGPVTPSLYDPLITGTDGPTVDGPTVKAPTLDRSSKR